MLINLTNHPSERWSAEQTEEAVARWGVVEDYPFPNVPPGWSEAELSRQADRIAGEIGSRAPDAVLCQGEMCMTYALVKRLQERGIPSCAAVSERDVREVCTAGVVKKVTRFVFRGFRFYEQSCGKT